MTSLVIFFRLFGLCHWLVDFSLSLRLAEVHADTVSRQMLCQDVNTSTEAHVIQKMKAKMNLSELRGCA